MFVAKPLYVAQHNGCAVLYWQRTDRAIYGRATLIVNQRLVLQRGLIRRVHFNRFAAIVGKAGKQRYEPPPFSQPQLADSKIGRDTINIGRKTVGRLIPRSASVNPYKGLLGKFGGSLVIIQHSVYVIDD